MNIIPPEEWISIPYFSGSIARDLYPFWKERFIEICRDENINEVILYGGIGGGKTYFSNVLLIRKLYELSCYGEDVWDYLGIARGSSIYFVYFSVSLSQAFLSGYRELVNLIDSIPYFVDRFPRDKDKTSRLDFPNAISVLVGSKFQHQLGLNVVGAVLDEANFRLAKDRFTDAFNLYSAITARRLSRFAKEGKDLGISILISSAKGADEFVERRISASKERAKVIYVRSFDVKKVSKDGNDDGFWVFTGLSYLMPRVIDNVETLNEVLRFLGVEKGVNGESIEEVINGLNEGVKMYFTKVPAVYRSVFDQNVVIATRDILGVGIADERKLFKSVKAYEDALINQVSIFGRETISLSIHDNVRLQDYVNIDMLEDSGEPRYLHVDLGIRQCRTGIASAYVCDMKNDKPVIRLDFIIGIEPAKVFGIEDEVPIWKVRDFLLWYADKVSIGKITFDSFQSIDTIQLLKASGFNVELLSVDRSTDAYVNLANLYLEGRIRHVENSIYRKELFALEFSDDGKKIVSPVGKDLADAVAGACYNACKEFKYQVKMMEEYSRKVINERDNWKGLFDSGNKDWEPWMGAFWRPRR